MQERIDELLTVVTMANQQPNAHRFLPYLARSLRSMSDMSRTSGLDHASLAKAAGALGRIVTDDYAFSESSLGQRLLDLINDIAAECSRQDVASTVSDAA